jgi:hypothetical protein
MRALGIAQPNQRHGETILLPKPGGVHPADFGSGPHGGRGNSNAEQSAQETIYLCNFRVSVDGEWLCLKELQDMDIKESAGDQPEDNGGNFGIIENVKCEEKIIERDWVNYYCRCYFIHLFIFLRLSQQPVQFVDLYFP